MSRIVEKYNEKLRGHACVTPEKISSVLRKQLQLATKISTGGYACLLWNDEKMKNLFGKTSTTSTTSTIQSKPVLPVVEVVEIVEVDSKENFENISKNSEIFEGAI